MTSPLGKLLRLIRLNKNISELKASRRAELPIEKYVEFEREPEKVPIHFTIACLEELKPPTPRWTYLES